MALLRTSAVPQPMVQDILKDTLASFLEETAYLNVGFKTSKTPFDAKVNQANCSKATLPLGCS